MSKIIVLQILGLLCLAGNFRTSDAAEPTPTGEWEVLFDGGSTDKWRGYGLATFPERGWALEGNTLKTVKLPKGVKGVDLITKEKFEHYELELEWKVEPGGNSGVIYNVGESRSPSYHTGPEMQILDNARHKDGKNPKTSAGALYALVSPAPHSLHPAGEWNRARLIVRSGVVEHWLNGTKLLEYEWASPEIMAKVKGSKFKKWPGFMTQSKGHIALQFHGEEAWFRNIRIRRLMPMSRLANRLSDREVSEGWQLLFDGESTAAWRGFRKSQFPGQGWVVENECIKHIAGGGGGDIITLEQYSEFEFQFEWKVAPKANSGVKYFIKEPRGTIGHEYQVIDDGGHPDSQRGPRWQTAAFYDVFAPTSDRTLKPVGEFNHSRIYVKDGKAEHWLNGAKVLSYDLGSDETLQAVRRSKFKRFPMFGKPDKGHLLLQDHQDEVWYRNLKVRRL